MSKLRPLLIIGLLSVVFSLVNNSVVQAQHFTADTIQVESNVKVHSPHKATVYAAVLPGLGQIYNKKYWKLPILYGGIGATIYAINWNTKNFKRYKSGFKDFSNFYDYKYRTGEENPPIPAPTGTSYEKLYTDGFDFDESNKSFDDWFKTQLQNKKDKYKRDRDFSYIILAAVYVLNIVDAAVDAHFTDFNVNEDLTINVRPAVTYSALTGNSVGFTCQITF